MQDTNLNRITINKEGEVELANDITPRELMFYTILLSNVAVYVLTQVMNVTEDVAMDFYINTLKNVKNDVHRKNAKA